MIPLILIFLWILSTLGLYRSFPFNRSPDLQTFLQLAKMYVVNASPEVDAQSNYPLILGVSIPLVLLMTIVVGLRLYVRVSILRRPGPDDWCIVAAAVSFILLELLGEDGMLITSSTVLQYHLRSFNTYS